MKPGERIKLRAYGGESIVRCVIRLEKDIVVVCQPEEYEVAHLQGREPIGVGFHITDIIDEDVES